MGNRIYQSGFADLAGNRFGSLLVLGLFGRTPLKWNVRCERCKSQWAELHTRLQSGGAECRNTRCTLMAERAELHRQQQQRTAVGVDTSCAADLIYLPSKER
jgi:hypothetical protein